jgi:uncharacterized ion transporter superfamily protein YfcC
MLVYYNPEIEFCAGIFLFVWLWRVFVIILIIYIYYPKLKITASSSLKVNYQSKVKIAEYPYLRVYLNEQWAFINSVIYLAFTSYYKDTFS